MDDHLRKLLDAVVALRDIRAWDVPHLSSDYFRLVRATIRVARSYCMAIGKTPSEFDARLGAKEFWRNPWR